MKIKLGKLKRLIREHASSLSDDVLFHFDDDADMRYVAELFGVDPDDPRVCGSDLDAPDEDYLIDAAAASGWTEVTIVASAESLDLQDELDKILRSVGDTIAVRAMNSGDDFHVFSRKQLPQNVIAAIDELPELDLDS